MLPSRTAHNASELPSSTGGFGHDASVELKFIADLGRSLLFTVHPKKVAERITDAIRRETGAMVCAMITELDHFGLVSACSITDPTSDESVILRRDRLRRWVEVLPPQVCVWSERSEDFFLDGDGHAFEFVAPLHINGNVRGAIIVGFDSPEDCPENSRRLIEAAAQMVAMNINLTAHYEAAIHSTVSEAREQHRRFTESVLDALPISIYVIDRDYRIVTWNRHRELGNQGIPRDRVLGRHVFDVLTRYPKERLTSEFERAFVTGNIELIEQQTIDEKGMTRHWLVSKVPMKNESGEVTHVITVGEDVTMRVEAIQAVARAEKLAAVGRLAAGVVHEINNPLATISACAESLEQRTEEGAYGVSTDADDLREYLELIRSEAFRCKTITTGLLDFSRSRPGDRLPVDLEEVLRSSAKLVNHQGRGRNIRFEFEIEPAMPTIVADGGQLQQALISLATNAIDAMPNGGVLTFRASTVQGRVQIEVSDTGAGIPPGNMSKIFEPFFTTKELGKGTGLGLSVCYGIISEHGGRLSVRSTVGLGSTFKIILPLTTPEMSEEN
jgi:two-component system NtrC family sensor kinase